MFYRLHGASLNSTRGREPGKG